MRATRRGDAAERIELLRVVKPAFLLERCASISRIGVLPEIASALACSGGWGYIVEE
jgi:hypothetical protein